MATTTIKIKQSEIFSLANKLRGEQHLSMKEAYAKAKEQLIAESIAAVSSASVNKVDEIKEKLMNGRYVITYVSPRGVEITTKATLNVANIPTNRKIVGRREPKIANAVAFYDQRHGQYRTVDVSKIISMVEY